MTKHKITYGDQVIPYTIKPDPKRHTKIAIHVEPNGTVVVDAPPEFDLAVIHTAVQKRARWVVAHVGEALTRFAHVRPREYVSGEQIMYLGRRYVLKVITTCQKPRAVRLKGSRLEVETKSGDADDIKGRIRAWYRVKARDYFAKKIAETSDRLPWITEAPPFRLMDMTKQWGSCSREGQVILNPHLIKAPRNCIEYVIMHELAHLKHHDHSAEFWRLIDIHQPKWRKAKSELDALVEILTAE
ncbi:M48 family metallopeptidase [Ruegeria profundi]|uniref:M48 family metallopeptidase n=1 Tax=Ruegeria profundi TaxID=1685378 RepID=UPI001CD19DE0|nr:SprT family zinc-dependent metalloprotease [Ruegeria profundi]MCA0930176.1 M48 family metallopeptidase [Ruegeria profundi]